MRTFCFSLCLSLLALHACFDANAVASVPKTLPIMMDADSTKTKFYQFTIPSLNGELIPMDFYKGKKVVVLNVASKCGYTPQYADWEAFFQRNGDKVVVLGFPCNDFGGQEPGSAAEIETFCQKNYGVTFPLFEKLHVKGAEKAPLFQWLTDPAQNGWNSQEPSWNFCKYVINEKGELTHFFGSNVKPDNEAFRQAIGL
ncbi:MAG: glutathione peroxidase [Saprospiraceae bacterium]